MSVSCMLARSCGDRGFVTSSIHVRKPPEPPLQYGQRQQEFLRLECKVLMRLDPFRRGADVEDRLLEVEPVDKLAQVQIIPMLSDTVERLVQRREALLIIEN